MQLNKKYQPSKEFSKRKSKADVLFPIFLPSYRKFSAKELESLYYHLIVSRNIAQVTGKEYQPFFITGLANTDVQEVMKEKSLLPFFAKLQRLSVAKEKNFKKKDEFLSKFFLNDALYYFDSEKGKNKRESQFFSLLKNNDLLKKEKQLIYWDGSTQTMVNEDDIEWREEEVYLLEIKCFVEAKSEIFSLVTDDILEFFSDGGVLVHHNDKRYKKHIGKKIILPIINKPIMVYGEEGIDTIKDNGIVRLNPLFSQKLHPKADEYLKDSSRETIDVQGKLTNIFGDFAGRDAQETIENLIEMLEEIGNLGQKQKIKKLIPYSKISGMKLMKRVLPLWGVNYSNIKEVLKAWLQQKYPHHGEEFCSLFEQKECISLETIDDFSPIAFEDGGDLKTLSEMVEVNKSNSVFEAFLRYGVYMEILPPRFLLEEVIDILYVLPSGGWTTLLLENEMFAQEEIDEFLHKIKTLDPEELVIRLQEALAKIDWLQLDVKKSEYQVDREKIGGWKLPKKIHRDELRSRAMVLLQYNETKAETLSIFAPYPQQMIKRYLLLAFLEHQEKQLQFVRCLPDFFYQGKMSEKLEIIAKEWGWDPITLALAKQLKLEPSILQEHQEYLQHFRNIFKFLYEQGAFDVQNNRSVQAMDTWIYHQWDLLVEKYKKYQESGAGLPDLLCRLQSFTQRELSWYLEYLKKNQSGYGIAAEIFLQVMQVFSPYLPILVSSISEILEQELPAKIEKNVNKGEKDNDVFFLFELIKNLALHKEVQGLKKHQPINLVVKASPAKVDLLKENLPVLYALFRVEEIESLLLNQEFPSDLANFQVESIEFGCRQKLPQNNELSAEHLEKKIKDKSLTLDHMRQVLMMLRSSPLSSEQKIQEIENEIQHIKDDIDLLDIQIKKVKMKGN